MIQTNMKNRTRKHVPTFEQFRAKLFENTEWSTTSTAAPNVTTDAPVTDTTTATPGVEFSKPTASTSAAQLGFTQNGTATPQDYVKFIDTVIAKKDEMPTEDMKKMVKDFSMANFKAYASPEGRQAFGRLKSAVA